MTEDQDVLFLEFVLTKLLDHPEKLKIIREQDGDRIVLSISVDKEDMGKLIGKGGKTAKSLRTLLKVLGSKRQLFISLKIQEPEEE